MIQIQKESDKILISITSQLDREDVYQLVSDLNKWLEESSETIRWDNQSAVPSGITFHNPAHQEAFEQAMSKRKWEDDISEYIAKIRPTQHIEKELRTIELDPIEREIIIDKVKLKQNAKKGI